MPQYNFYQLLHPQILLEEDIIVENNGEKQILAAGNSIEKERLVRIPQIQRDYAQGRQNDDVRGKRTAFLKGLLDTLYSNPPQLFPIDFIYGYLRDGVGKKVQKLTPQLANNTTIAFEPLDGQQRLTTLFVLHWLFGRNKELIDSRTITPTEKGLSLFSYKTRESSEQFCNELIHHNATSIVLNWLYKHQLTMAQNQLIKNRWRNANGGEDYQLKLKYPLLPILSFSEYFRQQDWFNWKWNNDATITSMLNVMDTTLELLQQFNRSYADGVGKNMNLDYIVFDLLDNLDCDGEKLFVKMNSRGKFLSNFDLMKSKLEEELELQNVPAQLHNQWSTQMDGNWIDYCWDKKSSLSGMKRATEAEDMLECITKRLVCHSFLGKRSQLHNDIDSATRDAVDFGQLFINVVYSHGKAEDNVVERYADYAYVQRKISKHTKNLKFNLQQIDYQQILKDLDNILYINNGKWEDVSDILFSMGFKYFGASTPFLSFYFDKEKSMGYQDCVMFHALLIYCRWRDASTIATTQAYQKDLYDWMSFVQHVSINVNRNVAFDTPQRFDDGIKQIDSWFNDWEQTYSRMTFEEYLANNLSLGTIEPDRQKEEQIKSQLRLGVSALQNSGSASAWGTVFNRYEKDSWLTGQFIAPLEWCKQNGIYDEKLFDIYMSKLSDLVDAASNNPDVDAMTLQAMLCLCDYRKHNSPNFGSLLSYNIKAKAGLGWKQYLRTQNNSGIYGDVMKQLIDAWVKSRIANLRQFLTSFISTRKSGVTDWRKYIIDNPSFDKVLDEVGGSRNIDSATGYPVMVVAQTTGGQRRQDLLLTMWANNRIYWGTSVTNVEKIGPVTSTTTIKFTMTNGNEITVESLHNGHYRWRDPSSLIVLQMPKLEQDLKIQKCLK